MTNASEYKKGKLPIFSAFIAYFPRAIKELTRLSVYGAQKHNRSDFSDRSFLDETLYPLEGYDDAQMRHKVDRVIHGEWNDEDEFYHRVQEAWNAMVALEKFLLNKEPKKAGNEEFCITTSSAKWHWTDW